MSVPPPTPDRRARTTTADTLDATRRPGTAPGDGPGPAELLALAVAAAREAASAVTDLAAEARRSPDTKSSSADLVTEADRAAEDIIVSAIVSARPDDAIEGEEGASRPGTSGVTWHVDPIDGTTNYVYGIPSFSVSVAAAIDDEVVAGAVLDPSSGDLYEATLGGGARCNGEVLGCRAHDDLATALVATGFGYDPARRRRQAEVLVGLLPQIRDIRRFGSAALDLCAVGAGRVDAYYERGLNRWDLAAGALVASEAGATVADLAGGAPAGHFTLAATPGIFPGLEAALVALRADDCP